MSNKKKSRWRALNQPAHNSSIDTAPDQSRELSDGSPSTSPAQLAANRSNAQLSTGPVTQIGREIVSQNATKHGLTGKFRMLGGESQAEFDKLLAAFLSSEQPVGEDEVAMVHQMAECIWLSRRSMRMQDECWATLESGTEEEKRAAHNSLALYMRYQTAHDRTFIRYATELRKRRSERRRAERGFVSQRHKEAAEARRVANENRKQELHELRRQAQILRQERIQINNQLAGAKLTRPKTMAAAA